MTNKDLIDQFIADNSQLDPLRLALQLSKKPELPTEYIINQIQGRKIAKNKLPDWNKPELIFPNKRALEQCSSAITATYKATLVNSGDQFIDLTGGFGVDTYYLGKNFKKVTYVEANPELFEISESNLKLLLADKKLTFINDSAESFLNKNAEVFNLIYLDPDRRVGGMKKGVKIEECSPNLIQIEHQLLAKAKQTLVKFSPLLDIKQALKQVSSISHIYVVSVNNDCKEVLFSLDHKQVIEPVINCVNFTNAGEEYFSFSFEEEENAHSHFSDPSRYLYEPNASILKAGAFKSIGAKFNLNKIAINSHFYTSNELVSDFPGRSFEVIKVSNQLKGLTKQANIISRNHPLTPEEIKKKGKMKDGGNDYLIASRLHNNKPVYILCNRIK